MCSRPLGREDCEFKANPGYITRCLFKKYTFLVYVQFAGTGIYIIHIHTQSGEWEYKLKELKEKRSDIKKRKERHGTAP